MSNQGGNSGWPLDINQIRWAMRHGQKIDGLESIMISGQPVILPDNHLGHSEHSVENNSVENNNSVVENSLLNNTVLKEELDKLGQSLSREIISLKSEFAIVAQGTTVEEQIGRLEQSLNQGILSLRSEFATFAQNTAVEEQIIKLAKPLSQEILSLRNEFAMFVQAQLQQEKAWKIAESEWKSSLEDRESKLQAYIREMQQSILEKFEQHFQHVDAQLQNKDNMLIKEVSLLTSQLAELQHSQDSKEEVLVTEWQKKLEERQTCLIEDMAYIQYVLEEIATSPQSAEAQQKRRENFFIREMSALKEEIASILQEWKSLKKGFMVTDGQQYNTSLDQQEIDLIDEAPTQVYKRKKRRRY